MNKYLRAISANLIFFVISVIFFLLITPFAIKVMGEEFYGLWAVLIALMSFSNVGTLGVGGIVAKFSAAASTPNQAQIQSNRVMTSGYLIVFVMSAIMAAILLLARNLIADNINTSMELREQFRLSILWMVASIFPQFLARVPNGFLISQLQNQTVRQIELFLSVSLWSGAIVLTLIEKNLVPIAAWSFFNNMLAFGLYLWAIKRFALFQFQFDTPTLRKMLNFSGYMFLESLAVTSFQQFDKLVVSFTLGPALAGIYSVGTSLALRLSMVTAQATEVMIPYASLKDSLGDQQKLYITFRKLSRYVSLTLAILSSLLIIWMHEILSLWISPDYSTRYADIFRIFIIAYNLLSLCRPAHQTLTGMGKVKFTSIVYLLSTVLMLITLFFLSRQFGLIGATVSNLVLVSLLAFNLFVYRTLQSRMPWRDMFADLRWGLFLPILFYGLSLFLPKSTNTMYNLVETIILGILFTHIIINDSFAKATLLQVKQVILKSRI